MTINIRIKLLTETAKAPFKATNGAACFDLYADHDMSGSIRAFEEYTTNVVFETPPGYVGLIYARSSVSATGLQLANGVGVVDSDYRGPVKLRFYRTRLATTLLYQPGDRIGQIMFVPIPEVKLELVQELSATDRGTGGFGSSGR